MNGIYHVAMNVRVGEFTEQKLKEMGDAGGCDAAVIASIARGPHPDKGAQAMGFESIDGYTRQPLTGPELFRVWSFLAVELSKNPDLSPWQTLMLEETVAAIQKRTGG